MASVPFVRDIGGGQPTLFNCFSQKPSQKRDLISKGRLTNIKDLAALLMYVIAHGQTAGRPMSIVNLNVRDKYDVWVMATFMKESNFQCFHHNCSISTMTMTMSMGYGPKRTEKPTQNLSNMTTFGPGLSFGELRWTFWSHHPLSLAVRWWDSVSSPGGENLIWIAAGSSGIMLLCWRA